MNFLFKSNSSHFIGESSSVVWHSRKQSLGLWSGSFPSWPPEIDSAGLEHSQVPDNNITISNGYDNDNDNINYDYHNNGVSISLDGI